MRFKIAVAWVAIAVVAGVGGCSDQGPKPPLPPPPDPLNVSNPVQSTALAPRGTAVSAAAAVGTDLAYVSLDPGAYPGGQVAEVSDSRTGSHLYIAMADGGFDPVPVIAAAGDALDFTIRLAAQSPLTSRRVVPLRANPGLVRTYPPPRKRDVALNGAIIMYFSEPTAKISVIGSSVHLFRGTTAFAGTLSLLQGTGSDAAFTAAAPLAPNTDYQLVVTQRVRDLDGDALTAGQTVAFTTGQSSTGPPASISLSLLTGRDTLLNLAAGTTYPVTATVRDAAGNILIDQPVTWSSSDPNVLTVSQTGVLTAAGIGFPSVPARVAALSSWLSVNVSPGPPASVTVSPTPATVTALDTILLTATVRDAAGSVINYPSVNWTSSATGVASVAPYDGGSPGTTVGTVTGVNPGGVTITATSGAASGTVAVTVGPAVPVASVTVTPASAKLVLPGTVQLAVALRDANGKLLYPRPTTWTSDNTTVARVDANGLVTPVAVGSATVTATREGVSGATAITVDAPVLAFLSGRTGPQGVYFMNADGSAVASLTYAATELAWSPDGQKIAFVSYGSQEVLVMNADGSAPTNLTNNAVYHDHPTWSPDGQKIAFVSAPDANYEIYVMNADGSAQTNLTKNVAYDDTPVWSPDGLKLAFLSSRDGNYEVYVMNADGSAQTNLTNNAADDYAPAWSPDGLKLAFVSARDANDEIYVMNADCSAQTNLTNNAAGGDYAPAWSPDGQKIAFTSYRDGNAEIYVMNADGSAQTNLTNNAADDYAPAWSPDGLKIAFVSVRDGNQEIYVINADGSAPTNLTNNAASDYLPRWRP